MDIINKVIRKKDPSKNKRKSIQVVTLKKVENFLNEQLEPVFKSEIVKKLGVDFNSLNMALEMLEVQVDESGRVSTIKKSKGGSK